VKNIGSRANQKNVQNLLSEMFTPERAGNNLRFVDTEDVKSILRDACSC